MHLLDHKGNVKKPNNVILPPLPVQKEGYTEGLLSPNGLPVLFQHAGNPPHAQSLSEAAPVGLLPSAEGLLKHHPQGSKQS